MKKKETMQLLSLVIPVYCEEKNIPRFYERLKNVTKGMSDYLLEYIFVNDGSLDGSYTELQKLATIDRKVKVLNFSRNFGKEAALSAGVEAASGDAVITIDCDLQHPPELILEMIKKWKQGADVVATIRKKIEKQPLMRRIGSGLFYWLISKISEVKIVSQTTDFRLIDKKVAHVFKTMNERSRIYRGIIDWLGFKKDYINFEADARVEGNSSYSYKKLFNLAINSITSFSLFPLKLAGLLGVLITFFSGILLLIALPTLFIFQSPFFSPLFVAVAANTFLIGIVLICLGFIALYIGHIHGEVVNRPLYIVKDKINFENGK